MALDPSEARLLIALRPFSELDPGMLIVHQKGDVRRVQRAALLRRVQLQLEALRACEDRLPYKYTVARRIGDQFRPELGSGSKSCDFEGLRAAIATGPGYCHITASESQRPDAHEERRIAAELGLPVDERWLGQGTVMVTRELHDLRDMQPVTIDGRSAVKAVRRRWDTKIVEKVAALARFIEDSDDEWIEVFVS